MLNTINEIKKNITDEQTLTNLSMIENELTKKKYGLIWEEHEERVDKELETKIPVFEEIKDKEIVSNPKDKFNFLLEGDNLHSLYLLKKTHLGKIDVIYIDPPYNTGNKDFMYNDRFVDVEDGYRHSKWLSFMENRLKIAKDLLCKDGIIFISIDENETAQLKMLCDNLFGEINFVSCLPRITKKSGKQHSGNVSKNHDYVLIYCKNKIDTAFRGIETAEDSYTERDEFVKERGKYKLNQTLDYNSLWYNPTMDFPIEYEGVTYYAGGSLEANQDRHNGIHNPKDWVWRWSKAKFDFGVKNGFVVIKPGKDRPRIYTKTYLNATIGKKGNDEYFVKYISRENNLSSIALTENEYSNDNAKKELDKIFGSSIFDFPKPTSLIKTLCNIVFKDDYTVLDFFAGSGTTAHAVLELNKEDRGNRKFILCTNNESNICEEITYQRIKTVITGIKKDNSKYSDGIDANLKYYKCSYIARLNSDEENLNENLMKNIKNLIQLENGIEIDNMKVQVYLDEDTFDNFTNNKELLEVCNKVYISSDILIRDEQEMLLENNNIEVFIIPEYYFEDEIIEVM